MKKLLIATTNPGKLEEISRFLGDLPLTLVSLKDLKIKQKPKETGKTFDENAVLKAKFYEKLSGLPTLADDGGLEIEALHGEPGVKSHRWIHGDRDDEDEELILYTLHKLKLLKNRKAQLRVVIALVNKGHIYKAEAKIPGIIPEKASLKRYPGFPYRSLLFIPKIRKFYANDELTPEETETYNHRKKALKILEPIIRRELC